MNILALDTCTEVCSAALTINGQLHTLNEPTQRGHSDLILGMFDTLFEQSNSTIADVQAVAFGRGPGSFTGVRVGVGVAQGVAFARDIPVIPISTLSAVAQHAIEQENAEFIAVAMDARMGEVYAAHFENKNGLAVLLDEEQVCPPEHFKPLNNNTWFAAGTGWREFESTLNAQFIDNLAGSNHTLLPNAASIIKLAEAAAERGQLIPAEQALPVYLRNNVAKKKGEQ